MFRDYLRISRGRAADYLLPAFSGGVDVSLSEEVLPFNRAAECFNFDFSSGVLKAGYGVDECFIDQKNLDCIWVYNRFNFDLNRHEDIVMFSKKSGEVFYHPVDALGQRGDCRRLEGVEFTGSVRAVNYRLYGKDVVLLCSDHDPMTVWDGENPAYRVESSPLITSLAMHYERMFVTISGQKNAVWFSDDLDPTNWSVELGEGGFIEMMDERGSLNKVISYLNYVYIFREHGITRLSAYSDQEDFSVSNLFVSSGKIYPETVCLCGDRVVFLASDGLYAFDGLSTVKILKTIGGLFEPSNYANAVYSGGKYYLAARLRPTENPSESMIEAGAGAGFGDGDGVGVGDGAGGNNGLVVYDIAAGSYSISRGMDIRRLSSVCGETFAVLSDGEPCRIVKNGAFFGLPLNKKWSIPKTDFGRPDRVKFVKNMYVYTKHDIEITLKTDVEQKTIKIKGRREPQRVLVGIRGTRIGADIIAKTADAEISRPMLRISG